MYSRYGNDPKRPIRLPEHYGGSTFSQKPTEPISVPKREPVKTYPHGVEEKASPVADRLLRADRAEETIIEDEPLMPIPPTVPDVFSAEEEEKVPPTEKEKATSASPFNFAALRRLFGGKEGDGGDDQDRLLLLGLILLLSRTEGDSDILLWLSLLLLCG